MFNQEITQSHSAKNATKPGYKKQYFGMIINIGPEPLIYPKDFKLKKRSKRSIITKGSDSLPENEQNPNVQCTNDSEMPNEGIQIDNDIYPNDFDPFSYECEYPFEQFDQMMDSSQTNLNELNFSLDEPNF